MNYTVQMWLSYSPADQSAQSEFRKRFPASLEAEWEAISMTASSETELANLLNGIILSDCKDYINSDTGLSATEIVAFASAAWGGGGGASHQTIKPVSIDVTEPSSAQWTFVADSKTYQMLAECTF